MVEAAKHEAVLFFGEKGVTKEMLFSEFESILDGLTSMPDLPGKNVEMAFVNISGSLAVKSLVFFTLQFDKDGFADKKWNVPLRSLANKGMEGPDLGAGPISIYMQASDEGGKYSQYLWDPSERNGKNDLIHIRNAVRANSLCLIQDDDEESGWMGDASMVMREPEPAPQAPVAQAVQNVAAKASQSFDESDIPVATSTMMDTSNDEFSQAIKIIESQRVRITALENALKNGEGSKGPDLSKDLEKARSECQQLQEENKKLASDNKEQLTKIKALDKKVTALEKQLEDSSKSMSSQQQQSENSLEKLKAEHEKKLKATKQKLKKDADQKLKEKEEGLNKQFNQDLEAEKEKQVALEKQLEGFKKELTELRGDKFRLMKGGAEEFFQKIADADISFMTFKPGVGHLTIKLDDIGRYMNTPNEYCAEKCGISLEQYEAWLVHYNKPECMAPMPGDTICGDKIMRTDVPANFKQGFSDRCSKHGGK